MSQHHSCRGAVATCVVGGRLLRGALARPRWRVCPMLAQHALESRIAGQIHAFVGQGDAEVTVSSARPRACHHPIRALGGPSNAGAHVDAGDLAGQTQPCSGLVRRTASMSGARTLAIFEADEWDDLVRRPICWLKKLVAEAADADLPVPRRPARSVSAASSSPWPAAAPAKPITGHARRARNPGGRAA